MAGAELDTTLEAPPFPQGLPILQTSMFTAPPVLIDGCASLSLTSRHRTSEQRACQVLGTKKLWRLTDAPLPLLSGRWKAGGHYSGPGTPSANPSNQAVPSVSAQLQMGNCRGEPAYQMNADCRAFNQEIDDPS